MNRRDTVVIGCDGWAYVLKQGRVVRDLLEELGLNVHFYPLRHKREVSDFLSGHHVDAEYVVLCCHGQGEKEENARIVFRCTSAESGHFNSADDRDMLVADSQKSHDQESRRSLVLTPSTVAEHVGGGRGTLINVACGSGRESFAKAFLDAGYDAYIGPEDHHSSVSGAYWFLTGFFHYVLAKQWGNGTYSDEEAVEKSSINELTYRYYARTNRMNTVK